MNLRKNEKGATAVEYALLAGLIAIVAVAGMEFVGNEVKTRLIGVGQCIKAANAASCGS